MTKKIIVELKDIDQKWLEALKAKHGNATLEINVNTESTSQNFSEAQFWEVIGALDWAKGEDTQAIIQPAIAMLKNYTVDEIFAFQDCLAHKLYQLDQKKYALHIGTSSYNKEKHFSSDIFLYARAAVVANGKDFYERVLQNPEEMPSDFTFEALLSIAPSAYKKKTGQTWDYLPTPSYETYSNSQGWDGKSWKDQIL
ncbi:MAG: DUF4240 domain-containing protein [Saprospiraceae bacterium]|nr:DUF4240 domain-containing protein [Saprospiraceae bacterium]